MSHRRPWTAPFRRFFGVDAASIEVLHLRLHQLGDPRFVRLDAIDAVRTEGIAGVADQLGLAAVGIVKPSFQLLHDGHVRPTR